MTKSCKQKNCLSNQTFLWGNRVSALQGQVQEVTEIMTKNVESVIEREGKLEDLNERAELLAENAEQFKSNAKAIKKKTMWENMKMKIIIAVVAIVLIIVILLIAFGGKIF